MNRPSEYEWEYWLKIYQANPRLKAAMSFECFIQQPQAYLFAYTFGTAMPVPEGEEHQPLLPRQREVAMRVAQADAFGVIAETMEADLLARIDCGLRDGAYIEPLHHHSYATSSARTVSRLK